MVKRKNLVRLNKKKKNFPRVVKSIVLGILVVFFSTLGIDAADHYGDLSQSIVGRLVLGRPDGPCAEDMVLVQMPGGEACIDRYEASAGDKCSARQPASNQESQSNLDQGECLPVSVKGNIPWTNISQNQASRACAKAGKRLLTDAEWTQSALGTPDADSGWGAEQCQVASNWDKQPGMTGSGEKCVSFSGAYDMVGNIWEWVGGTVADGEFDGRKLPVEGYVKGVDENDGLPTSTSDKPDEMYFNDYYWVKSSGSRAIARGGYWNNKAEAGQYSYYVVFAPDSYGGSIGFRCAKSPAR